MLTDPQPLLFLHVKREILLPVADVVAHGRGVADEPVRLAVQMGAGAAPGPVLGTPDKTGADGVEFDIAHRRQEVVLVHHERGKAPLPQVSTPALAEVDVPRIASVGLANRAGQTVYGLGHRNQMHVIRHQAIRLNFHPMPSAPSLHQVEVFPVVLLAQERLHPPVSPLGDVMRHPRRHYPGGTCHG